MWPRGRLKQWNSDIYNTRECAIRKRDFSLLGYDSVLRWSDSYKTMELASKREVENRKSLIRKL